MILLKKSLYSSQQHSRKWNIEIDGIPASVGDDRNKLEAAALNIFRAIDVQCMPIDIEAIHRLPSKTSSKATIIRFNNRKTVDDVFVKKKKLKNLTALNLNLSGLDADSTIYIRPSLCSYYKQLQYNGR